MRDWFSGVGGFVWEGFEVIIGGHGQDYFWICGTRCYKNVFTVIKLSLFVPTFNPESMTLHTKLTEDKKIHFVSQYCSFWETHSGVVHKWRTLFRREGVSGCLTLPHKRKRFLWKFCDRGGKGVVFSMTSFMNGPITSTVTLPTIIKTVTSYINIISWSCRLILDRHEHLTK